MIRRNFPDRSAASNPLGPRQADVPKGVRTVELAKEHKLPFDQWLEYVRREAKKSYGSPAPRMECW